MTALLLYLFLALTVSFLCSILESVFLSTPLSFVKTKEITNAKSAKLFINLKNDVDKPLSAILTLNTIAHTVGAAGVGAQSAKLWGDAYVGLVSAVLTILILVLTEIIPKSIGATYWRQIAMPSLKIIKIMIFITYPIVLISTFITGIFSKNKSARTTSREEICALANIGEEEGIFEDKENKIIQNLIKLKNLRVTEVMTPRVVVVTANEEMSLEKFLENKELLKFSRIPIYAENEENITGYVMRQEVFEKLAEDETGLKLKDIKRKIVIVPFSKPLFDVWDTLLNKKEHIALVVDEYGGVDGIITMEDIIESLLGFEIIDEKDTIEDMQQYARERWKQRQQKYEYIDKDISQQEK
jgi:CBS domain containing-hemolysin-like protein